MSDISSSRDQQIIDELLADAGMDDAGDLRPVLLELRALAADSPRPSAAVEALMAQAAAQATVPVATLSLAPAVPESVVPEPAVEEPAIDELAARRRRKRRLPLTALTVAAALAAGGAAAAASDENFRHTLGNVGHAVTFVVGTMTSGPAGKTAGQPATDPAGTVPGSSASTPATPAPSPADGRSVSGGQPSKGTPAVQASPLPSQSHAPELNLPKPDPRDLGSLPGSGQLPSAKPLPSSPVSPDPSGLVPAPPVELPLPGHSPSPGY
ncbi:hypothetical protein ASF98_14035 [Arthrobacter sp. Leaf337]|uniref:hypothetical protein n=1 Tax=Arthrobacter sp. Leaf337 TaxID=1736342 RepID=UPI0006F86042|nr:hypothetical protein [Arthrobacter sp. Leaf337]KQR62708.1 hypothetical protein ASF98_14035 [Arthrobacter sp. Leaf337]